MGASTPQGASSPRTWREGRVRRLAEELAELGWQPLGSRELHRLLLDELDYALHPLVHERRIPSYGSIVAPSNHHDDWYTRTGLRTTLRPLGGFGASAARPFADGLSSWLVRASAGRVGDDASVVFDRPAGSERDVVLLARSTGGVLVQRHPSGVVRLVGEPGVLRHDGIDWHHEPPLDGWLDAAVGHGEHGDVDVLTHLLDLAVHELGARHVGALLVYRPHSGPRGSVGEVRMDEPPPLNLMNPADLAPLTHALSQLDGACVFDRNGTLRELGVRLIPSAAAESDVAGFRGMRHTSARRYSYDDPGATVIVVSEDGPVTVIRNGTLIGRVLD